MDKMPKILTGFELFGEEKETDEGLFVSIHHARCIMLSKTLTVLLGLDIKTHYVSVYYNGKTSAVGMKFLTAPLPNSGTRKINIRCDRKHATMGSSFDHVTFCKFYKIPAENQTRLPVTVDRKDKIVIVKLRRPEPTREPASVASTLRTVVKNHKRKSKKGRGWTKRQPTRQVLFEETIKLLQKSGPLATKETALLLFNASVIPSMERPVLDRVSEVFSTLKKRDMVNFHYEKGRRYYQWIAKT